MHKDASITYLAVGLMLVIGCVAAFVYLRDILVLGPLFLGGIMAALGLVGVLKLSPNALSSGKSREAAQILSFIPGSGHIYLGRWKRGMLIVSSFLVSLALLVSILFIDAGTVAVVAAYGLTILIFSVFWSMVDIQIVFEQMDLPFEGGIMDLNIKNFNLAENVLFMGTFVALVSFSAFFVYIRFLDDNLIIWVVVVLSLMFPLYCFAKYLRIKKIRSRYKY